MGLGLKDYHRTYRRRPVANLRDFCYEVKYACQRFWRGYDDTYLFNFDYKLDELIPEVLRWRRYNREGNPILHTEETCEEDWNAVLDEMLFHFQEADDEISSMQNNFDMEQEREQWSDRAMECYEYQQEHHKRAYLMLAEHIGRFWD